MTERGPGIHHSPLLTVPSPSSSHSSLTFLIDRSFNKYDALLYLSQLYGIKTALWGTKGGTTAPRSPQVHNERVILTTRVLRNGLKKVAIIPQTKGKRT